MKRLWSTENAYTDLLSVSEKKKTKYSALATTAASSTTEEEIVSNDDSSATESDGNLTLSVKCSGDSLANCKSAESSATPDGIADGASFNLEQTTLLYSTIIETRSCSNADLAYIIKGFAEKLSYKIVYNQVYRCMTELSPFPAVDIFDEVLYPLGDHRAYVSLYPYPLEIQQFVWHLVIARKIPVEIIVSAFIYILNLEKAGIYLYASNWRCIVLATILVATKCVGDFCVWNQDWILSTFPSMRLNHLNQLEREFLIVIKYELHIPHTEYINTYGFLLRPQS